MESIQEKLASYKDKKITLVYQHAGSGYVQGKYLGCKVSTENGKEIYSILILPYRCRKPRYYNMKTYSFAVFAGYEDFYGITNSGFGSNNNMFYEYLHGYFAVRNKKHLICERLDFVGEIYKNIVITNDTKYGLPNSLDRFYFYYKNGVKQFETIEQAKEFIDREVA